MLDPVATGHFKSLPDNLNKINVVSSSTGNHQEVDTEVINGSNYKFNSDDQPDVSKDRTFNENIKDVKLSYVDSRKNVLLLPINKSQRSISLMLNGKLKKNQELNSISKSYQSKTEEYFEKSE